MRAGPGDLLGRSEVSGSGIGVSRLNTHEIFVYSTPDVFERKMVSLNILFVAISTMVYIAN